jgi:hypothetical protein
VLYLMLGVLPDPRGHAYAATSFMLLGYIGAARLYRLPLPDLERAADGRATCRRGGRSTCG